MSTVHVFGLDHFHQSLETWCFTSAGIADEQKQKAGLHTTLREIIAENAVEQIAEEGELDRPCLGDRLAAECGVEHINITMPIEERERHGVKTPQYELQEATRKIACEIFERYMFDRVKAHGAGVILIMCGRCHFRALERLFRAARDNVRAYDIHDYSWYRGRPREAAEGVVGHEREP